MLSCSGQGQFLIVLDSADRENEGDLIISAAALTPEACAFMIHATSGYLCVPLTQRRADELGLKRMVTLEHNEDPNGTAYCVSVDAAKTWGTTTGISAVERAATANVLAGVEPRLSLTSQVKKLHTSPHDLRRPGHILPLIARDEGVRMRRGHTEAGVDFARLAGQDPPVAVIGELIEEHNSGHGITDAMAQEAVGRPGLTTTSMMRAEGCLKFGRKWGIKVCTIEDLVKYLEHPKAHCAT